MAKKSFKLVKASAALAVTAAALTPVMAAEASTSTVELKAEVVLGGKFKEALALNTPKGVEIKWGKHLVTAINTWQTIKGQGSDGKTYIKKLYARNYPLYIFDQDLGEVKAGSELEKPSIRVMYRDGKVYTQAPERFTMSSTYNTKDAGEQKVLISYNHNGNRITSFLTYTVKDTAGAISSAKALGKTTVEVALNQEVDAVSAANFSIADANVTSATLKADKKTVTLEVSGLDYAKDYVVAANNIMVKGEAKNFGSKAFKSLAVNEVWNLKVTPKSSSLVANGSDNTEVMLELVDVATGRVDAGADNIVLDLNATFGTLSSKRVTIQDGKATVVLTSEFSNTGVTSKIDAQIIEASGDYKALIGKVAGSANVTFATASNGNVETVTLIAAESNQADRFTLFFDKAVSLDHFVKQSNGKYLYKEVKGTNETTSVPTGAGEAYRHAFLVDGAEESVEITQNGKSFQVKGFKPVAGNPKAMEVILDKTTPFTDNARVEVEVNTVNSISKVTKSSASFVVTDARKPEATSVAPEGLNTLKVKFSESIAGANFLLDGRFVEGTHFDVAIGDYNPVTLADNRDLATLSLKAAYNEGKATSVAGYFGAGQHSVQISSIADFAYATDRNNLGSTQNLYFDIVSDPAKPTASVSVESPEQFRVKFDKSVAPVAASEFVLQRLVNGKYVDTTNVPYEVTRVSATEYVVELTEDWTSIYKTSSSNKNYYNDDYRIFVAKDSATNIANGLKNEDLALDLNYAGSLLNTPDVTSPVISQISRVDMTRFFDVTMSEPVKLVDQDDAGNTLAQKQGPLTRTTAQFIGKDKDGKTVTIDGVVPSYSNNASGMDNVLRVEWSNVQGALTPQAVVDGGGSTEWTLVVRAISDDVGNTAASATKSFTVAKSPAANTPFKLTAVLGQDNEERQDTVKLTFSEGVQTAGISDATNPAQYTINGKTLPTGTSIRVSNEDAIAGFETVTIELPDGTLSNKAKESNVITVNKDLLSHDGSKFEGPVENTFKLIDHQL
ncbi:hypothetical protein EVJ32_02815 [Exiguobacterium sp. SH5S4]|uniref:hypothetical protein n=1 Tax=Exiguobacterium sp. SH5S4 TaxID=2510961 RepID=UPI00103C58AF|nr:hypothetical protein [Exiguobacterium sp. SH5S4]TCI27142.1 hypothetical protein EVJ32_02815 [Exiguobacterium sp. SH5S4]